MKERTMNVIVIILLLLILEGFVLLLGAMNDQIKENELSVHNLDCIRQPVYRGLDRVGGFSITADIDWESVRINHCNRGNKWACEKPDVVCD